MVVKNNYFWVDENSPCGFIANGDLAEVMSVRREIELYGMRFARVELSLTDYPQMPKFEALILLDTLYSQAPALPEERSRAFFEQVMLDYEDLPPRKRFEALAKNEYYNAIQVKFGYAVTCHKAQGGGSNKSGCPSRNSRGNTSAGSTPPSPAPGNGCTSSDFQTNFSSEPRPNFRGKDSLFKQKSRIFLQIKSACSDKPRPKEGKKFDKKGAVRHQNRHKYLKTTLL